MKLHLLLDLDDTLLKSNPDQWGPAYFQKLAEFMSVKVQPEKAIEGLLSGIGLMFATRDPAQTIEQVFNAHFYPKVGVPREELSDLLEKFYDEVFPTLQSLTSPLPGAVDFVEWAFARGWDVSVATDPLFPRKAIMHRLRWAGLPPEKYPFRLISDFQNFHFAKINSAYYPEFLLQSGWESGPVLMVGDSLERDIYPAQKAGLPVFWLRPDTAAKPATAAIPQGWFSELKTWLETVEENKLLPTYTTPEAHQLSLLASPAALHTRTRAKPESQWTARPAKDEWALTEILCHLRDVEREVNLPRLENVLAEENAFIAGQVTDPWAEERQYIRQDGLQAFTEYVRARKALLEKLDTMPPAMWERKARHTIFGPTTLLELVGFMAEHDRAHAQQAFRNQ